MNLVNRIKNTIDTHEMLGDVRHLVIGFSGGPDSMCLFDSLINLKERGEIDADLYPVHINHGIRKGICDEEEEFCRGFSALKGYELRVFKFDCEKLADDWGMSTEEAGRKIRYDSFRKVIDELNVNPENAAIALAHNYEDQVETIIMRVLRGTGVGGLTGIPYVRDDISGTKIIRPILDITREGILEYCSENGLEPRMDESNYEPIYRRNEIRLNLIPYLEENYNPGIKEAIIRLGKNAAADEEYLKGLAKKWIDERIFGDEKTKDENLYGENGEIIPKKREFNRTDLMELPYAVRHRVIDISLGSLDLHEGMGYNNFQACERAIYGENPSAHVELPGGFFLEREYEKVIMGRKGNLELSEPEVNIDILPIEEYRSLSLNNGLYGAFDYDLLNEEYRDITTSDIFLRGRRPGDYIGLKIGTKKIQDLLTDDKVPKRERENVRLVSVGSEALMVIYDGVRIKRWSEKYNVSQDTKRVVLVTVSD